MLADGSFCGRHCDEHGDCPVGYGCRAVATTSGGTVSQCAPDGNRCTECLDTDGDGYGDGLDCLGPDCAPQDAARHPDAVEQCNNVDDDCDGDIDEELSSGCLACGQAGERQCVEGAWHACLIDNPPAEACDRVDNDCDGLVDEELSCAAPKPALWIFIMAGQSNMVGLGTSSELSAADAARVSRAHIYYNDSVHPNPNALQWLPLGPGFGVDQHSFGPELSFGHRMRELWPERTLAIIKVAEGATALYDRWTAGSGDLYQLLVAEVRQQMADLTQVWSPRIVGFMWMQGESDAFGDHAYAYQDNLEQFMRSLRSDLDLDYMPASLALISPAGGWPKADVVRAATSQVATNLGQIETVETNDLPLRTDDGVHYNTQGNLVLGRRFADCIAPLVSESWGFPADFGAAQGDGFWSFGARADQSVELLAYSASHMRWQSPSHDVQIGRGWMRPDVNRSAEVGWWAPYPGRFNIQWSVSPPVVLGGDGAWVEVADPKHSLWGKVSSPTEGSASHGAIVDLAQGERLLFSTAGGVLNDVNNDTIDWDVDIVLIEAN